MKKNHFITWHKLSPLAVTGIGVMFMCSCAVDGFNEETFDSGVSNTQLTSPSADSITFKASTDGSKTTISWPVTFGAGGYLCSLYDVTDPDAPVAVISDSTVDGSTMTVARAEDTNYEFHIQTLGNDKKGNTTAVEATTATFTSFTPAYAVIPDGTDLSQWLAENPLPTDRSSEDLPLELTEGGHYTMSSNMDFAGNRVTFRTTNKTNRATITIGTDASFITYNGLALKNIILDCAGCTNSVILLSETPSEDIKDIVSTKGYYYIENPFYISNCLIENLPDEMLDNNQKPYCIKTFLIDNSVFHFATGSGMSSSTYFNMYTSGGCINDFTAKNSTFYNSSDLAMKYFLRYNNSAGPVRTGYTSASVNLTSCTFYNIVKANQIANYDGMKRTDLVTFTLHNNIIVDTGSKQFVRRYIAGASWGDAGIKDFVNNTYFFDGENAWTMPDTGDNTTWTGEAQYDRSGTILSSAPGLKDPANGDFTVSGTDQIAFRTGDPRWLPEE